MTQLEQIEETRSQRKRHFFIRYVISDGAFQEHFKFDPSSIVQG